VLNVINLSHAPRVGPAAHLLVVNLHHGVASDYSKWDGILPGGKGKGGGGGGGGGAQEGQL